MKKAIKTALIVVCALIALWTAVFITDMIRCNSVMEPLFAIKKGVSADDGGSVEYTGIFYTVRVEKHIGDGVPCIESIEMRAFGKTVAACIVECTHMWEGEDLNTQSCCNKEDILSMPETDNIKDFIDQTAVLKEPPALTVICAQRSVEALRGTTSWIYDNADGTSTGIASDSMHPLQAKEYMAPLSLMPSYLSHIDPFAACLQWNVAPDKVSVRYWSEDCWGKYDTEGENIPVMTDGNSADFILELKDGDYIYEVTAEWNSSEKYSGKVYYSFYTEKPDMKIQPIE